MNRIFEVYRLTLTHYAIDPETQEKFKLEDPIRVEQMFDRTYGGAPIILNRMFDEMKTYVLTKIKGIE